MYACVCVCDITDLINLELQFGSSPVSSLRVVSDRVVRLQTYPLWHWSILFQFLCQTAFQLISLMGRLLIGWLIRSSVISIY